jgi:Sulfotransferase family
MGTARAGSTILGVALGNCEGVFYAGELGGWLVKSGVSWLEGAERQRFWDAVRERVDGAEDLFGSRARESLEVSLSLLRLRGRRGRRELRRRYRRICEQLVLAIARESGASHIVDTSSHPLRARELRALDGVDLYLIFLSRDPQSVVVSFTQSEVARFSKSATLTNAYISLTNLLSALVFATHPRERRIFVRYEDFAADPEGVVRQILARVGSAAEPPDFASLRTGIPFQGNRLLREGETVDFARTGDPSPRWSIVTSIFQLPWRIALSRLRPAARANRSV